MEQTQQEQPRQREAGQVFSIVALCLILVLGLGLRLYRIEAESIDLEEFVTAADLDAPDMATYIRLVHQEYKPMTPLSFALQYWWVRLVGYSAVKIRLLTVFEGLVTIWLLYAFTTRFFGGAFGRRAGCVAALCLAVSPVHVFYSQEARQYPLLTLMALLSAYAFMRALRESRRRWWVLNAIANFAVVFTHLFGLLLFFAQGVFLVLFRWRRTRQVVLWGTVHALMLIPLAIWVRDMPRDSQTVFNIGGRATVRMALKQIACDLVGDDAIYIGAQLGPVQETWPFLPQEYRRRITAVHRWFDVTMVLGICAALLWIIRRTARQRRRAPDDGNGRRPCFEDYGHLLTWFVAPPLALGGVSFLWTPCDMTRYTLYATLALYVIVGGAVASIRYRGVRGIVVIGMLVLYAYQLTLLLPGPIRAEWKSVAADIRARGAPDDLILIHGPLYLPIFLLNCDEIPNPAAATMSREGLCDVAKFFLAQCAQTERDRDRQRDVWAMVFQGQGPGTAFEACLRSAGYRVTGPTISKGVRQVLLYHVEQGPEALSIPLPARRAIKAPLRLFAKTISADSANSVLKRFGKATKYDLDDSGAPFVRLGIALAKAGALDLAPTVFDKALRINPAWAVALLQLQAGMVGGADHEAAAAHLEEAVETDPDNRDNWLILGGIHSYLCNFEPAIRALRRALDMDPDSPWLCLYLWRVLAANGAEAEAEEMLERALELDASLAASLTPLYVALYETRDIEAAKVELEKRRAAGLCVAPELAAQLANEPNPPGDGR